MYLINRFSDPRAPQGTDPRAPKGTAGAGMQTHYQYIAEQWKWHTPSGQRAQQTMQGFRKHTIGIVSRLDAGAWSSSSPSEQKQLHLHMVLVGKVRVHSLHRTGHSCSQEMPVACNEAPARVPISMNNSSSYPESSSGAAARAPPAFGLGIKCLADTCRHSAADLGADHACDGSMRTPFRPLLHSNPDRD